MAYFIPGHDGSFTAAIVDNSHVDGTQGNALAVWSAPEEGRARTRLRSIFIRERVNISEIAAPNGGMVFVMPLRYANMPFWRDFMENPSKTGSTAELFETDKLDAARRKFEVTSGFTLRDPEVIGRNRYGYTVYDRAFGRTAHKIGNHREIVPEWNRKDGQVYGEKHPEMFFRARNDFDLAENARSIFIQMANGEPLTPDEVDRLAAALTTPEFTVRPRELMEHVEAEISGCIAAGEIEGRDALDALMATFPRQRERTAATIINQQYSTPYPFGLAASQIFGDPRGKTVLEPTIGNGALAASFAAQGAEVTGFEIDHGRFIRSTRALGDAGAAIHHGEFLTEVQGIEAGSFDLVVANPPFDGLPATMSIPVSSSSFKTDRLHYAVAVEALQRLKPGGSAFFVLPANIYNPEDKGAAATRFHNLIKLAFDQVEEAVADGRLYQGMGTNVPVQIYAAHGFRETLHPFNLVNDAEFMGTPRTLKSFADLYEWADDCRARFGYAPLGAEVPVAASSPEIEQEAPPAEVEIPVPVEPVGRAGPGQGEGQGRGSSGRGRSSGPAEPSEAGEPKSPRTAPGPSVEAPKEPATPQRRKAKADVGLKDDPLPRWLTDSLASEESQPYRPFSRAGAASTVVPRSLSGAIYGALEALDTRLKREFGRSYDIDDYVADALRLPKEELLKGQRLSPEQVDGVALCLSGMSEGRGVLIGDLMGVGKGREQAAIVESSLADGHPIMFVTVKPALFSDFLVRDLADVSLRDTESRIASGEINVHLVNGNAQLMDRAERVIYRQKVASKGYDIPLDANVVASTYSQFQKADTGSLRLEAIKAWMANHVSQGRNPRLLLDEAHKAASPDSNTGAYFSELCRFVEENGGVVIWSSATGIKTGQHIDLYYSALPDTGLGKSELLEIMAGADALSLQEALSHEMAAAGSLYVRQLADLGIERDLPRLVDYDPEKIMRVRDKVDAATEALRDVIDFIPNIEAVARSAAREHFGGSVFRNSQEKLKLDTNSPVTNLHHFSGYLTLATKGQFLEELVTDSLARGEKQVFTIEHMGASVLQWKMTQPGELLEDANGSKYFLTPPNLGDALKRYVSDAVKVRAIDALGERIELDLTDQFSGWVRGMFDQIDDADLSDMRVDGADMIKAALDRMGLKCGELTGRVTGGGIGVSGEIDGKFYLYEVDKGGSSAPTKVANQFNSGDLDALVLNKSSSAGISLQAARSVGDDLRRRCMIKMELQSDIVDERQIEGRVNRNGQVDGPRYVSPLTGFVSDDRLASLFNRKNRSLSASTNATRENSTNIDEVVDLLNPVGREVVYDYLTRNPHLALGLDIDVGKDISPDDSLTRKLLGRLIVRPLEEQTRIIGEIDVQYRMKSEFLDRRGLNPNKNNRRDWRGRVVDQEVLLAENRATGLASQPVYLTTIEAPTTVAPMAFDQALKLVKRGLSQSQLQGDLPELMSKAFDEGGNPKFQSRPWLKAVGLLDRSYFESGESRDVNKMAEELKLFHSRYSHSSVIAEKLKTDGDKAKLETIRGAMLLHNLASTIEVGRAVFLKAEYVPELAECRLTTVASPPGEEGETWIPAIVTSYGSSGAYPLDPDYHHFDVAIPGEAEAVRIKIGNVARHIKSMGGHEDNWPSVEFAVPADDYLLRYANQRSLEAIQDWLVPHPENAALFKRATPTGYRVDKTLPKVVTKRPEQEELYRGLFDRTVAGEIMEQKTVLTGNMFRALILTRQKNKQSAGTKIIFSDSKGVWHHGIEVSGGPRNEKLRRIRDKAQVTASSSATLSSPFHLDRLFRLTMELDGGQLFNQASRGLPRPPSPIKRVNEIYGVVGGTLFEDKIRADGMPPMKDGILAPSCAFVGPDVFSEKLMEMRNGLYRGLNRAAGVVLRPYISHDPDRDLIGSYIVPSDQVKSAISSTFKEMKRGEMYYFPLRGYASVLFNPKNETLQAEFSDLLDLGSSKSGVFLDGKLYSAPIGMVGITFSWSYDHAGEMSGEAAKLHARICEALMRLGESAEQPVLVTGAARMLVERLDAASFELQRENDHNLGVSNDVENIKESQSVAPIIRRVGGLSA